MSLLPLQVKGKTIVLLPNIHGKIKPQTYAHTERKRTFILSFPSAYPVIISLRMRTKKHLYMAPLLVLGFMAHENLSTSLA